MIGVTFPITYPSGILYETDDGIFYPRHTVARGHYVFDRFQPTQALTTILLDIYHCEDVGYLIKPKTLGRHVWPTGVMAVVNSRINDDQTFVNKDKVSLVFKGDFYLHNVENTATLLTIDSLPLSVEKLLTIQG